MIRFVTNLRSLSFRRVILGMLAVAALVTATAAAKKPTPGRAGMQRRPNQAAGKPADPPVRLPEAVVEKPRGPVMKVAPIDRGRRADVLTAAADIDRLLAAHWQAVSGQPSEPLTDELFARRAYLDLGGRIPTYHEITAFLNRRDTAKRAHLVESLLESPDYVSHFYNFWADILRLVERPDKRKLLFEPYLDWVKQSIAANRPYNAWVHEMLSANGSLCDNPAVGYQLRDRGMPLPYVDNTVRVFLGTQIGCAQCHDHPFDKWTQKQFYELAAFTAGTRDRLGGGAGGGMGMMADLGADAAQHAKQLFADLRQARQDRKVPAFALQFLQMNTTHVTFKETPLRLPHDYKYDDAVPLAVVSPKPLWGDVPTAVATTDRREQFASWLTSSENRQFARAIANRLWKKMMGVGLVEPIDDFQDANPPTAPDLLEHLTDEIVRLDYDLREFIRVIAATDAYQRRAVLHDPTSATVFAFPAPALRRMTAEQLWDSVLTLVAHNEWAFQRPTVEEVRPVFEVDFRNVTYEKFVEQYENFENTYGRGYLRRIQQIAGYKGQVLVRSSELPSPLPLNHLLTQFGQGDRQASGSGRQAATVPQILTMLNGWTTHSMLEKGSVIYDDVVQQPNVPRAIDVIFLSLLSRRPTSDERRLVENQIKEAPSIAAGCGDAIWALLNTREFLFVQ